ncbi:MAG TPA: LytTR family DNA-binding domain-containing protein [Pseudonocardiaceae bacterium]|jgi:DNA-binding LytR/AlgR family response regulator
MNSIALCERCHRRGRRSPYQPELRLLAVDDEPAGLDGLMFLLRSDPSVASVTGVTDAIGAIRLLREDVASDRPFDGVFLDVRMRGLCGLDIARLLAQFDQPPPVVFVTACQESAVQAFELKALDYVLKPVREQRLADTVHRILHATDVRRGPTGDEGVASLYPVSTPAPDDPLDAVIPVELAGVTRFVKLADVDYVEAQGDYIRLRVRGNGFLIRAAMSTVAERWHAAGFVRIHRSFLVQLKRIEELRWDDGRLAVRVAGTTLPVSRRHAQHLRDVLVRGARVAAPR